MPNTPRRKPGTRPRQYGFRSAREIGLSREERRADERHAESLKLQEKFIKVNQRISLATLIYAIAAVAMLLLSLGDIFLF